MERYINWPGQATSYKIGQLKIVELRRRAEQALGNRFDIRDFHEVILGNGALPLDVLESQVDAYIASRKSLNIMADTPPDRLSLNHRSPYFDADTLRRGVGIRFKGRERTDVEEYCISEGWIRVAAGKSLDRHGQPVTIKLSGEVEPYFQDVTQGDEPDEAADRAE